MDIKDELHPLEIIKLQRDMARADYEFEQIYNLSLKWLEKNGVIGTRNGIAWTTISNIVAWKWAQAKYYSENYKDGIPIRYTVQEYLDALTTDYSGAKP